MCPLGAQRALQQCHWQKNGWGQETLCVCLAVLGASSALASEGTRTKAPNLGHSQFSTKFLSLQQNQLYL